MKTLSKWASGLLLACLVALPASAGTILDPTVGFTLRGNTGETGGAIGIDDTWNNGGFQGFVTSVFSQTDHTQFEFDMSGVAGPATSATLIWTLEGGSASDPMFIDSYAADGVASLSDWVNGQVGAVGTDNAAVGTHSLDITSLFNASLGLDHLGISFSIDAHPSQAFFIFDNINSAQISYESASVPEPGVLSLLVFGLLGMTRARNRKMV